MGKTHLLNAIGLKNTLMFTTNIRLPELSRGISRNAPLSTACLYCDRCTILCTTSRGAKRWPQRKQHNCAGGTTRVGRVAFELLTSPRNYNLVALRLTVQYVSCWASVLPPLADSALECEDWPTSHAISIFPDQAHLWRILSWHRQLAGWLD